jgi:hypothetical protein
MCDDEAKNKDKDNNNDKKEIKIDINVKKDEDTKSFSSTLMETVDARQIYNNSSISSPGGDSTSSSPRSPRLSSDGRIEFADDDIESTAHFDQLSGRLIDRYVR